MKCERMLYDGPLDERDNSKSKTSKEKNVLASMFLGGEYVIPYLHGAYVYAHSIRLDDETIHDIYFWRPSRP